MFWRTRFRPKLSEVPLVSLVVPAYNREEYVAATIESIRRQTHANFEAVIWDDGSVDKTVEIAKRACGDDPRIQVVPAKHAGVSGAINAASRLVTAGKYFGCVDSDDALAPTALEKTVAILERKPDVGMVYTDHFMMDEAGRVLGRGTRTKTPYSPRALLLNFMTFHFRLMRREVFDAAGMMNESMDAAVDYDLCLRLCERTAVVHLPRALYYYRVHRNSISSSQRLRQILQTQEAITRALVRRGLDNDFYVDLELLSRFYLRRKPTLVPEGQTNDASQVG